MYYMQPYDDALRLILEHGVPKTNKRTGSKTLAICGIQNHYRLEDGFPIVTRRKVWPKSIFAELLWFLSGSTNNKDLQTLGANIWTPWVSKDFEQKHGYADGCFGPVYGFQLRYFGGEYGNGIGGRKGTLDNADSNLGSMYGRGGFDQLAHMIKRIGEDPTDRRILFSLWNPRDTDKMRLPPCHYSYQIFIDDNKRMSGMLTQRSADTPVGVPANVQFYSALTMMIAQQTGYQPYEFIWSGCDCHIYWDQIDAVKQYLATPIIDSPKLNLHQASDIHSYKMEDFELMDFKSGPKIEIPVAI